MSSELIEEHKHNWLYDGEETTNGLIIIIRECVCDICESQIVDDECQEEYHIKEYVDCEICLEKENDI